MLTTLDSANPSTYSVERIYQHALRFVFLKLFLTLAGFVFYVPVLLSQWNGLVLVVAMVVFDLLFLIPYMYWSRRGYKAFVVATLASVGLTTISMTCVVSFFGDFTQVAVATFLLLIPLALVAVPRRAMAWSVAGMITLAYVTLVALQLNRWIPVPGIVRPNLSDWLPYALIVIGVVWLGAIVASIFATWLEHRLLEMEQRALAESIWSTVGKAVVSTQELDQVLTTVIQAINEKMQVETGSILLRDPASDEIYFAKVLKGKIEQFQSVRLKVGQGVVGWVIAMGKSVIVQDATIDPRWYADVDRDTGFRTESILCVPLLAGSQAIGAIELLNKFGGKFTPADLQLMESIAAPVAIAVQNAQLHARIVDQLTDLSSLFHQVQHAKKEWETTVDAIDAGIVLTDQNGQILRANTTLADWLNTSTKDLVGQYCWQAVHNLAEPPTYCPHVQVMEEAKRARETEIQDLHLGGVFRVTSYPLQDADAKFLGSVTVLKNITEEKEMQAQLIQSEKMAATGRLAASLAHEINNPLQGIQGCLDLVEQGATDVEQQRFLVLARKEVTRLTKMVRGMLDFSRPSPGAPKPINLRTLVEAVLTLSTATMHKFGITTKIEWADEMPLVNGVEDQLKQVFLNLVLNAIEAMPKGGKLEIRGELLKEEGWIIVCISDTGLGLASNERLKIFEPFYTTKEGGTGLGLSVSHNFVTGHGGRLTVESVPNQGSTFTVWLPLQIAGDSEQAEDASGGMQ